MKSMILVCLFCLKITGGFSCTCSGYSEYSNGEMTIAWYNDHAYIFTARIDSVEQKKRDWTTIGGFGPKVYLTTEIIYKGEVPEKPEITSWGFGSSCEFDLSDEVGLTYIFYANVDERGIHSHFCDGTKRLYTLQELDTLRGPGFRIKGWKQELQFLKKAYHHPDGKVESYYSNRKLTGEGKFENGLPTGYWEYYTFDGKVSAEGLFKNGLKDGEWKENTYQYDYEKNKWVFYSYTIGLYQNGLKNGEWKIYHVNGEYWNSEKYEKGQWVAN